METGPGEINKESATADMLMITALGTTTGSGPNDQLRSPNDSRNYWISTVRVPIAMGWQTALFDQSRLFWLSRPLFQIIDMTSPIVAILHHLTTIVVVGENARQAWPTGRHATSPDNDAWSVAFSRVKAELSALQELEAVELADLVEVYTRIRSQYHCRHR